MTGTQADRSNDVEGFRFKWPFPEKKTFVYKIKNYMTLAFVSSLAKIMFLPGTNKLVPHNKKTFMDLWEDRSRPLITISNHRCNIDDPLMWAMINYRELLRNIDRHRYTLAAHNICFTKQWHTNMFSLGQCVPCVRGEGVYQKGMDFCIKMLNENGWVHIFPEGRVTQEPIRFKWGVGRLVMESKLPPIVLPIWTTNMNLIWPTHPPYYPRFGQTVEIFVGEPFDTAELRDEVMQEKTLSEIQKRKKITDVLQSKLFELGEKVKQIPKGTAQRILSEDREGRAIQTGNES